MSDAPLPSDQEVSDLNEIIADIREILAEFDSEDVRMMARRAVELIAELRREST